ncbi:hypothetical protein [Achromobacter spanius]|uniref:hypothetical protein n=1 Tax=Achromobacter spanius TaxID=217203 RepID=UPI000F846CB4|nr:hypothetical protein [Achromobacter spanius]
MMSTDMKSIICAGAFSLLVGCAATGDDYVTGVRPAVVIHPVLGKLTIEEQDLLGPDANQNGVRDELDKAILSNFGDDISHERAQRYALEVSKAMIAGASPRVPSKLETQRYAAARDCLNERRADAAVEVLRRTTRTKARAEAMARWVEASGGLPSVSGFECVNVEIELAAD